MGLGWDYFILPSEGRSGGIMVLWKSDLMSFSVLKTSDQCVISDLNVFNKGVWMVFTVYASKETVKRRHLWEVVQEASNRDIPSIVGGDFNCILSQEDKKGVVKHLARVASDQCPIVLKMFEMSCKGRSGIKFEDTWLLRLLSILSLSKARLKNFSLEKDKSKDEIPVLQDEESKLGWLEEDKLWLLKAKVKELNVVLNNLNTWWRQRAKAKWVKDGDANTKFFHSFANSRRNINWISQVKDANGELSDDPGTIEEEFMRFFQVKWESRSCSFTGWPKPWTSLLNSDKEMLNRELNEAEISEVILNLGNNRAPGFDGISYSFFKAYWKIIRVDVVRVVQQFFRTGSMNRDWKDTLVVMVEIMPKIISEEKVAFVKGRSISDHLLIAREVFNKLRFSKASNGFLAIKVDLEQAYDSMCCATLERMLIELGFPSRFVHLVMDCIINPRFSIVINGSNSGWTEGKSDFRQGCPLSPFLFILCSQLLSNAFRSRGNEVGIRLSTNAQKISHMLFVDAILLFFEAKGNVMKKVRKILEDYCKWTGQNINYHKTSLVCGNSVDRRRRIQISIFMGIKLVDGFEYLGIKLPLRRLRKADFQCLLDNSCKKINAWGNKFVSFAGRMVLVKSVFLSLPIYTMTHSLIPMSTLLEFDKICRDFIWNKCDGKRGLHYLAWDHVCKPKEYGGWGVQSAMERRDVMRAKFTWKLIHNPDSLLSRQLNAKNGESWWNYRLYGRSSSTWKILFSRWNAIREIVRWKVADGTRISVLKDIWILDKALIRWPTFVATFEDEDVTLDCFITGGSWDRMKLKQFFGTDLVYLICMVQIYPCLSGDSMELKFNMSGKSTSAIIMEERYKNLGGVVPFKWVYKLKLNDRLEVFLRRLFSNALPTAEFLCKRKLADDSLCPLGCDVVEDCNHITTYCCKLRKVLDVLRGWGFQIPVYSGWCECLVDLKWHKNGNLMLIKMYFTVIWFVWNHKNKVKHEDPEESNVFIAISILSFISQDRSHIIQSGNWVVNQPFGLSFDKWQPPPPGWIKINIDASLKGNYEADIGGIVRDCKGRFLLAFGRKKMHWDIAQLEMEAITDLKEVLQGRFHGVEGIVVEGDNKNVIDILHNMHSIPKNMDRRMMIEDSFFLNKLSAFKRFLPELEAYTDPL
ncbi:uncharacterized protein LOC110092485 [Dendrobium catenatum]|uniref:uncharacterized protein LOC110092485 n=1 Tax=Dendrobium catenatum TaxID=906689 RepID=UPI0009F2D472|nr:uncharacterized protein LOC110092485 [Dendrobium catenatum]